jgi:hypothetical protein
MSYSAGYLPLSSEGRDQMDWTPEFSRRARGFATYAALRQLARRGERSGGGDAVGAAARARNDVLRALDRDAGSEDAAE